MWYILDKGDRLLLSKRPISKHILCKTVNYVSLQVSSSLYTHIYKYIHTKIHTYIHSYMHTLYISLYNYELKIHGQLVECKCYKIE